MRNISRLFAVAGITTAAFLCATTASAAPVTITSTVDQSGYNDTQDQPSYPLTLSPYNFTAQNYASLTSITSLSVTLTINDGDTGPGQFAFNNLTLGLDGIDTGIVLNGFTSPDVVTLTFTQAPNNAALILAQLVADGKLVGTVIDHTNPADVPTGGDFIGFPGTVQTTLSLTGDATVNGGNGGNGGGGNAVPLPAAVLLAPLGAGIAGAASRRFRKTK